VILAGRKPRLHQIRTKRVACDEKDNLRLANGSGLLVAACLGSRYGRCPFPKGTYSDLKHWHAVLLDVNKAGSRLVAVGERGVVLLSDDGGQHWRQSASPISTTLTSVQFVDSRNGWAVGHSGVVLHSSDGGESWQLQLDGKQAAALELQAAQYSGDSKRIAVAQRLSADGADKPLLVVNFVDAKHGVALGAYGLALMTKDGGNTWQSWMGDLPNPRGLHLYAMARNGDEIIIAGEQGLLLHSIDSGLTFEALKSPYEGSYFAAAILPNKEDSGRRPARQAVLL